MSPLNQPVAYWGGGTMLCMVSSWEGVFCVLAELPPIPMAEPGSREAEFSSLQVNLYHFGEKAIKCKACVTH